jgi:NAD(P)-dependent dehydrogenase (short-subunit alcohol dehydrogenase family)
MDLGLQGRVAVITGAGRGIGLAVTRAFVSEGAHVVAGSLKSTPEIEELAAIGSVDFVGVDLSAVDGPSRLMDAAGPQIDILVNNVGSAPARTGGFLDVSEDEWQHTFGLNLFPAVRATRAVLPRMLAAGRGAIVTVSSVNARLPDPAVIDYSAAKAALSSFCKALSKEVGGRGIRVNTVSPGPVATALWLGAGGVAETVSKATGMTPEQVADKAAHDSVTGRFTRPEEVAALVVLLASDRAANVTGSDFTIDGGLIPTL